MAYEKILTHPNVNKIVKMLSNGMGVRQVSKWLKEKHPKDNKKHITPTTLQKFRKEHLNIDKEAIKLIRQAEKEKKAEKAEKKAIKKLKSLPSYKEKIEEAANVHVDVRSNLRDLLVLVKSRVEDLFDRASRGELSVNEEANLHKYFTSWTSTIQQWAKYVDQIADKTIETNINITVIEDQMSVIREAVREILLEMDSEMASKFLDKLNEKLSALSYRTGRSGSLNSISKTTKQISANISDVEVDEA